jgi:uncharacterized protein (TIGR03085 family)
MSEPIDASERRQLCELMLELGPDAPTLCEGWATADLAAHLVLREHFRRWPAERIAVEKSKGFQVLVTRLQAGAPLVPWRLPQVRTFLNGVEYFIHHEDVRRANGRGPRTGIDDIDDLAWRVVGLQARQFARRVRPFGLELVRPDDVRRVYGSGTMALLRGRPSELLLFVSGRRQGVQVTVEGPEDAIAAVERSRTAL